MLELDREADQVIRVYIGHDPRSQLAYDVAEHSLRQHAAGPVFVTALRADVLAAQGLLRRPTDARGGDLYDLHSNAPCSTEFAISRFMVPLLAQQGWALFVDCDVVFLADVAEVLACRNPEVAVQVVHHNHVPRAASKMCGATQTRYPRKNWSSVMLWNCDHPANRRLSLDDINHRPGRDLHALYWLADSEVGYLPPPCNWLVGEQPAPSRPVVAHFTNGGPWLAGWADAEHDDIWHRARAEMGTP